MDGLVNLSPPPLLPPLNVYVCKCVCVLPSVYMSVCFVCVDVTVNVCMGVGFYVCFCSFKGLISYYWISTLFSLFQLYNLFCCKRN